MGSQIVSFHCTLTNRLGEVLSSTFNQDIITELEGPQPMLSALSEGLRNLRKGDKRRIFLTAEQAYGFYDPDLVMECRRKEIARGKKLSIGDSVVALDADGERRTFRVVRADSKTVTLDANHPLAGQDLIFDIEALEARDATLGEIEESSPAPAGKPGSELH